MAKSRLLSCAAHGRKKTDELPVIFLAGTETYGMTHMTTYSDHVSRKAMALHNTHVKKKCPNIFMPRRRNIYTPQT